MNGDRSFTCGRAWFLGYAGAVKIAFGSDFDGITTTFGDLSRAGDYHNLVNTLLKRYKEAEVQNFMRENWLLVFRNVLQ
ncbi:membrane dipeptidase [Brevibacillus borstelensis]|uniref:membrane dipeptidase n=1 Tax=Brevibacillus borstelensis TaxID=45462 RepID=UPI0030C3F05C